jgi:hypothetical protein
MSFFKKLGKVFKPVLKAAAPILKPALAAYSFTNPLVGIGLNMLAGGIANKAAIPRPTNFSPETYPMAMLPVATPRTPARPGGAAPGTMTSPLPGRTREGIAGMAGRYYTGAKGIVYTATGKIIGIMRGQSLFRNRKIKALARQVGIETAAVALGITAVELAQMLASDIASTPTRRSRGISGADIRRTRRTLGKFNSMQRLISQACRPAVSRASPRRKC